MTKLTCAVFGQLFKEYLRLKEHPAVLNYMEKYPEIFSGMAGESILNKLREKYPPSRMDDKEYREMWDELFRIRRTKNT